MAVAKKRDEERERVGTKREESDFPRRHFGRGRERHTAHLSSFVVPLCLSIHSCHFATPRQLFLRCVRSDCLKMSTWRKCVKQECESVIRRKDEESS